MAISAVAERPVKEGRFSPDKLEQIRFFEVDPDERALLPLFQKTVEFSRAGRTWSASEHGMAVLEEYGIRSIPRYTTTVQIEIEKLEEDEIIREGFFCVPQIEGRRVTQAAITLFQREITGIDFRSFLQNLSVEDRKILAKEIAEVIYATGFADAHFGNFLPTSDDRLALVDCKFFGLPEKEGYEETRIHNAFVGLHKFKTSCEHFGFTEMVQVVQSFLVEHAEDEKNCPICIRDLEVAQSE